MSGCDKEGWAVYKALSGAYKYAMTQTFAIPTIDDAEKDKYSINTEDENDNNITATESLNENSIEAMFGDPEISDFDNIFNLDEKAG